MKIFEQNEHAYNIYQRAIRLAISKEFAEQVNGASTIIEKQNSEQENRRRELLAVEEEAKQNRLIEEHGMNHFKNQVMNQFYNQVMADVNLAFDNKENLYSNVLNIEDAAPTIMEILSLRAASIKRIAPLVNSLPWLSDELVKLVNKPQYRKRADVQVNDPNLALTYIGLENLKLVTPTFMLKHWLPHSTAPYPLMKRKMWNDALAIAMSAQVLAKSAGLDEFMAFSAGMFSNIGMLAVTRSFLQTYNESYNQALKNAYDNKDKKLHDVLLSFDMSPELLFQQLSERNAMVAADLVELMRFDRLAITEAIFDLAYSSTSNEMCDIAKLVLKAKSYIAFRSLAKEKLITGDEAKILLGVAQVTPKDIALLKKTDIDHIKLTFN